jgi:hypothetical protein
MPVTALAKPELSDLPDKIEQLIEQHVESLVAERIHALVKESVAQSMNRDPAKRKVAIIASKGTLDMCAGYVRRVTHDEIADAVG